MHPLVERFTDRPHRMDYYYAMQIASIPHIAEVDPASWNALTSSDNPFIKHAFLSAFEQGCCVDSATGWAPAHLTAYRGRRLVGALPLYFKFDDLLAGFSADKRKKVRRERRRVREAGIGISVLEGSEIDAAQWQVFYRFYRDTVLRKSGYAPLSAAFFQAVSRDMPDSAVLALARYRGDTVAAALSFRGGDTLHGRYWGASHNFHSLHFELCYYTGIEYCIAHGLHRFEPGAQGEHKISRGFLPTATYSAHWLADPAFRHIIDVYLRREREQMRYHMAELSRHGPYKSLEQSW